MRQRQLKVTEKGFPEADSLKQRGLSAVSQCSPVLVFPVLPYHLCREIGTEMKTVIRTCTGVAHVNPFNAELMDAKASPPMNSWGRERMRKMRVFCTAKFVCRQAGSQPRGGGGGGGVIIT